MAVRIQTYLWLLYQDLIRTKQLSTAGLLPPVLPLVLYNGGTPWDAARQLDHLIEPAPPMLDPYQPRQSYFLIDELRVAAQGQLPDRNLSTALFRLEASRQPAEVIRIVRALLDWLKAPDQAGLRQAFAVWFGRVFLPKRLPGIALEPMTDLFEVHHMLSEHVESWTDQWKRAGLEQGLKQGLEQGRQATRTLLIRQAHRRFGPETAGQAERLLTPITDPQQLEGLADLLLTCPDGAAWPHALQQEQPDSDASDEHQ